MRRKVPDFSYKTEVQDIVEDNFDPWQLVSRDAREGIHRLVNRTVSLISELDNEAEYIENMFFPQSMDLSEEWVLYKSYPEYPAEDIYISGQLSTDIVDEVTNIDQLLAGNIDILCHEYTISGVPYANHILAQDIEHLYLLGSGVVTEYDLSDQSMTRSGTIDTVTTVNTIFYADKNHRVFTIKEEYRPETVTVVYSGENVSHTLIDADDLTGAWNERFDANGDGVVDDFERAAIENALGLTQQQVDPTTWETFHWMDVNEDGSISESDYNAVMTAVPSAAPDVEGLIKVPFNTVGALTVSYEKKLPRAKNLVRPRTASGRYNTITDFHPLYSFAEKSAYDPHTDTYYGINEDATELRAYKYDQINEEVVSDLLMYIPRWSSDCYLVDLDVCLGTLYVLASDGTTTKMFYGDVWRETTEEISNEATIPSMSGQVPTSFTTMPDGYFAMLIGDTVRVYSGSRDKVMDIDGVAYFNRKYSLSLSDDTELNTVPHYIFNNWDSFAYSAIGLERPLGCDNLQMRKLIMDFWKHEQGHDKIGMNYGIMRELGLVNSGVVPSGIAYYLPAEMTYSGVPPSQEWDITVNGYPTTVLDRATPVYDVTSTTTLETTLYSESFESGIGGWYAYMGTSVLSQSSDYSVDGSYSLKIDTGSILVAAYTGDVTQVASSTTYIAKVWVYESTLVGMSKSLYIYDSTNDAPLVEVDSTTAVQTWTELEITFTTPANCTEIGVMVALGSWPPAAGIIYIDKATIDTIVPFEVTTTTTELSNPGYTNYESGEIVDITISGGLGSIQLIDGTTIVPDNQVVTLGELLSINGYFIDGNGDLQSLTYNITIQSGSTIPTITASTYGDSEFIERIGYTNSGEPTDSFVEFVRDKTETNPFLYGEAITDVTPMDSNRVAVEPVLETEYDVTLSGLLSGLVEVTVEA